MKRSRVAGRTVQGPKVRIVLDPDHHAEVDVTTRRGWSMRSFRDVACLDGRYLDPLELSLINSRLAHRLPRVRSAAWATQLRVHDIARARPGPARGHYLGKQTS